MNTRLGTIGALIVDDSKDECELLFALFQYVSSVRIIGCVHDGIDAIDYLRGIGEFGNRQSFPYPDLLLLDFNMPRCNGVQVLEFLRQQICRPRVILWSSTLDQINVPLALNIGADLVCSKPGSLKEVGSIIRALEAHVFRQLPPVVRAATREPTPIHL